MVYTSNLTASTAGIKTTDSRAVVQLVRIQSLDLCNTIVRDNLLSISTVPWPMAHGLWLMTKGAMQISSTSASEESIKFCRYGVQ